MTISRFSQSTLALSKRSQQTTDALAGLTPLPYTPTIGTATDGGTGTTVNVAFTPNATVPPGTSYTALSSPGSITASGSASPITVSGLTSGTAYTFQVRASNATGNSAYSAASNSVTPAVPSSYESIATTTAAGGETSITFSSIASTYKHLQLRILARRTTGINAIVQLQFNGDTASNYWWHILDGDGTTAAASNSGAATTAMRCFTMNSGTNLANQYGAGIIDVIDYASTSKYKTIRTFGGNDQNATGRVNLNSGMWNSTSAVTSIVVSFLGDALAAGSTFALYGIRG